MRADGRTNILRAAKDREVYIDCKIVIDDVSTLVAQHFAEFLNSDPRRKRAAGAACPINSPQRRGK